MLLTSSMAFGYVYDRLLLTAQAVILPKLIMLDKNLPQKTVDGSVVFTIAYEKEDRETAEWMQALMRDHYKNGIGNYQLQILLVSYDDLNESTPATAIYSLNSSKNLHKLYEIASSQQRITFAYDIANLKADYGSLITIMNEKTTKIYLNKAMLPHYNIDFASMFYQIAEVIND